jgi:hypothetical protein
MPPTNAMSVPERIFAQTSAMWDVRLKRGSTWSTIAPRSLVLRIQFIAIGWFSAGFPPMIITTSALTMSTQWLVIAPRPKVAARLATVELCQIRA